MSIIQEALKKVQKDIERKTRPPEKPADFVPDRTPAAPDAVSMPVGPAHAAKTMPAYAPYALVALTIIGGATAYILMRHGGTETLPVQPVAAVQEDTRTSAGALTAAAETKTQAEPSAINRPEFAPIELIKDVAAIPFGGRSERHTGLVLNGIMYLDEGPRAIINNSIVTEGDNIDGAVVRKINRKSVVLSSGGSEFTLNLK